MSYLDNIRGWSCASSLLAGLLTLMVCISGGCYDEKALIEARKTLALRSRLEEVDLGEFRITMPKPYSELERAEVFFHAFGRVANKDLRSVNELIAKNGPELKHRLLLAVRQMHLDELKDPGLKAVRASIRKSFNATIEGDPVQTVGFYEFGYSNY